MRGKVDPKDQGMVYTGVYKKTYIHTHTQNREHPSTTTPLLSISAIEADHQAASICAMYSLASPVSAALRI